LLSEIKTIITTFIIDFHIALFQPSLYTIQITVVLIYLQTHIGVRKRGRTEQE